MVAVVVVIIVVAIIRSNSIISISLNGIDKSYLKLYK